MSTYLKHHGILGMKWGVRRFRKEDGSLTAAGKKRYSSDEVKVKRAEDSLGKQLASKADARYKEWDKTTMIKCAKLADELSPQLADAYEQYYQSCIGNQKIRNECFKALRKDFGSGADDSELFDYEKEHAIREVLTRNRPKELVEKESKFKSALDTYFNEAELATNDLVADIGDLKITDNHGYTWPGNAKEFVKNKFLSNDSDSRYMGYMYRHYEDYWVEDVDSRYAFIDSITADDYNKWARTS